MTILKMDPKENLTKNHELLLWLLEITAGDKEGDFEFIEAHKRVYYLLKLLGIAWFDSDLPNHRNESFELYLSMNWSGKPPSPLFDIAKLSNHTLSYLCAKINKPQWLSEAHETVVIKLIDLPMFWKIKNKNPYS